MTFHQFLDKGIFFTILVCTVLACTVGLTTAANSQIFVSPNSSQRFFQEGQEQLEEEIENLTRLSESGEEHPLLVIDSSLLSVQANELDLCQRPGIVCQDFTDTLP